MEVGVFPRCAGFMEDWGIEGVGEAGGKNADDGMLVLNWAWGDDDSQARREE